MVSVGTLSYFPTPYPDEDIRSIVYRYHMRTTHQGYIESRERLFGFTSNRNAALPRGLKKLVAQLPQGCEISVDSLLKNNTLFPLIRPFIDADKEKRVYHEIFSENHQRTNDSSILKRINSKKVKYCPMCIRRDCINFGEVYLHRIHQIKFIVYCPTHKAKLLTECTKCKKNLGTVNAKKLIRASHCDCGNDLSSGMELLITDEQGSIEKQFKIIEWLLNFSHTWDYSRVHKYLYESAWNKGFYKYNGRLDYEVIFKMLSEYFTESYFECFGYSPTFFTKRKISSIFLTQKYLYNIFSITSLLIMFHDGIPSSEEEHTLPMANILPFGTGPWNCKNEKCENSKHSTIKKFHKFTTKTSFFKAHFKCNECGTIYNKSWDWNKRKHGKDNIVSNGTQVEILKLLIIGNTIKDIASMTKRSSNYVRKTLYRFFEDKTLSELINKKLDIDAASQIAKKIMKGKFETGVENKDIKIINHRKIIKEFIILNPNLGRRELANTKCCASYRYLLKNDDKEWLNQILPKKRSETAEELDKYFFSKVTSAYNSLLQKPKLYQIKKSSILNELDSKDRHKYYNHQKKLSRTNALLETLIESSEDYLVRNVPNIYNELLARGCRIVTIKSLCSRRKSYLNLTEITADRIKDVLRKLQETVD